MRRWLPSLLLLLAACDMSGVEVSKASVRLPIIAGRPGVAYFSLRTGGSPMRLLAVSSPQAKRIELHDTGMAEGVMRMGPIAGAQFPEGGVLTFAPGGKHAMLFDIDPAVKSGGKVTLVFDFDNAPDVRFDAPVEAVGG